ncbi:MAG: hypothetical protein KatS3mg050_2418 [Litorilinea sp.]|nr:MAG: hypothetical protein KatS3mg050_2418 [Litorilinea sp.]
MEAERPIARQVQSGQAQSGRGGNAWWQVLLTGLLLFVIGLFLLLLTGNPNLFPSVVLLGTFMVPVAYVAFFYERSHLTTLTVPMLAKAFVYGGLVGVFGAALLEPLFIRQLDPATAMLVGFIEEFVKIIGVLVIARRHQRHLEIDGILLGAAVGMGFAALESTGYAFNVFLVSGGSLSATVGVTMLRGILSPVGHGTWTAILAGVLFRESQGTRYHFNLPVWMTYLTVSILHGLWDALPPVLYFLQVPGTDFLAAQGLVGAIGLFLLWRRWRESKQQAVTLLASG